jgi:hypothetical protein
MLGLRRNTVSVRLSRIDRAGRTRAAGAGHGDGAGGRRSLLVVEVFPPSQGR